MIRNIVLLIFFIGCGIESGNSERDSFSFTLNTSCSTSGNASQCLQSNNGKNFRAYAILKTCATLFDTQADSFEFSTAISEAFSFGTGVSNCSLSTCSTSITAWSDYDQQGSITMIVTFDTDSDGVFGESGEPYACEDGIVYQPDVIEIVSESSADLGFENIL